MKFCYIDESEGRNHDVVVAAGIVVDGTRMHLTKSEWAALLDTMSARLGSPLREFKASELYRGTGRWKGMDPAQRGRVIGDVVDWIGVRRHAIVYSGVLTGAFEENSRSERLDVPDPWCAADRHLVLALQRQHQTLKAPKGHTVLVMDHSGHQGDLVQFVREPEPWTDGYYGRRSGTPPLNQIVDVPYFVESEHAVLVQTADLCAYVLRRYVEIEDLGDAERYSHERDRVTAWSRTLAARAPLSHLFPARGRTAAHEFFRELAPPSLVALRS